MSHGVQVMPNSGVDPVSALFDGVVLVAAMKRCGARELRAAMHEIENAKGVLGGIVLNDLPKSQKIK